MRSLSLVLAASLFAACQSTGNVNAPASDLAVVVSVIDEPNPSDGKHICVMQVKKAGAIVNSLGGGAAITCNGVPMPFNSLVVGFAERIPVQPVGGTYTFTYSSNGVDTSIPLTVPPRPQITAPPAGSSVARSASFSVAYSGSGGEVKVTARDAAASAENGFQPATGTYTGLDTSGFVAGPGTLRITRKIENTLSGTGFQSAESNYETSSRINVIWQ